MSVTATAISVQGISKMYRIGASHLSGTLRESVAETVSRPIRRLQARLHGDPVANRDDIFWALNDVSFEVKHGEVLGLIGRNGAGKSTLLKILSGITEPTGGRAELRGRVGSLLEVGAGFHPELTGRENVFLNGAILGMSRAEIRRKFDEIVAFAEIDQFLDTPVKRYSSGMFVRLAFAVAAHLEPEILLVDEVLAVGDVAFQKKCLGKMDDVARAGRTIIFVSHNVGAIRALCSRAILLKRGRVYSDGAAADTVTEYLNMLENSGTESLLDKKERKGAGAIKFERIDIRMDEDAVPGVLATGQPARFIMKVTKAQAGASCSFTIYDQYGHPITHLNSASQSTQDVRKAAAKSTFACQMDELMLLPGRYRINVALWLDDELQDHIEGAAYFQVTHGYVGGRSVAPDNAFGSVHLPHRWLIL